MRRVRSQLTAPALRQFHRSSLARAEMVIVGDAKPAVVTPNTAPNTHYTSSAAPATPPITPAPAPVNPEPAPRSVPSQPTQQAQVVPVTPPAVETVNRRSTSRSTLRSRLTSFFVGAALAGGLGYYRLQSDVWSSASAIESQIAALAPQLEKVHALESQISEQNKRIERLEASTRAATSKN